MSYVDGYVLPVPKKNLKIYARLARKAGKIWREHGALEFRECVGDDLDTRHAVSFPQQIKLKRGETVMFSCITFKSRADRDRVNAKVMKDPRLAKNDGCESDALRLKANGLWWFQDFGPSVAVPKINRQMI